MAQHAVSAETLAWLDSTLAEMDRLRPTVMLTHFPVAAGIATPNGVVMTPLNAEEVLARFEPFNLRARSVDTSMDEQNGRGDWRPWSPAQPVRALTATTTALTKKAGGFAGPVATARSNANSARYRFERGQKRIVAVTG